MLTEEVFHGGGRPRELVGGSHRVRRASLWGGARGIGDPLICWGTGQMNKHITDSGNQLSPFQKREL